MVYLRRIPPCLLPAVFVCLCIAPTRPASGSGAPATAREIAKLPTEAPLPADAEVEQARSDTASPDSSDAPAQKQVHVAVLMDNMPPRSAAEWIALGEDYFWHNDFEAAHACFDEAAATRPGSREAGRALVLKARTYGWQRSNAELEALIGLVLTDYSDPEVRDFATLVRDSSVAQRVQNWDAAAALYRDAAERWKRTDLGVWAALRLGDLYRDNACDYPAAHEAYLAVIADYPRTPAAADALISLAECQNWYEQDYTAALDTYRLALDIAVGTSLRVRAMLGIGDSLRNLAEYREAYTCLSELFLQYPDHPASRWARIYRAECALELGDWETVREDAQIALTVRAPNAYSEQQAHMMLAQDAFLRGLLEEAETRYTAVTQMSEETEWRGKAWAGIAYCAAQRGNLQRAVSAFLQAAESAQQPTYTCLYLYDAACFADWAGDSALADSIIERMVAEFPGSYLTTRLVGAEILPPPDI